MNAQQDFPELSRIDRLATDAGSLGYDIVDLAGFLHIVDQQAQAQRTALEGLSRSVDQVGSANLEMAGAARQLGTSAEQTFEDVQTSVDLMKAVSGNTRGVAEWVQDLNGRTKSVTKTLDAVKVNNSEIASIALQVNTLAINAKIEAARAGDAGRGFAIVAEAINSLSQQTKSAAQAISENIDTLTKWIAKLSQEAGSVAEDASAVLQRSADTDAALGRMQASVSETRSGAEKITKSASDVSQMLADINPNLESVNAATSKTVHGIGEANSRIDALVDRSEAIVQSSASLGGDSADAPYIEYIKELSQAVVRALETAIANGRITKSDLFDRTYRNIPGTNPEQKMARCTKIFDEILPAIQEPALDFSDKIVFCAAVDPNGYLPTHNRKFSKPQSSDPVWNTANCRNRRIFDDRVGLKAGRNKDPFLLQVYRRDMGGGNFVIMKDLSAPIMVDGDHWGGLRLAYTF